MNKQASSFVDFQQRAKEFVVGDVVSPLEAESAVYLRGRVVAVWPGIGMVDVEWPNGSTRIAVEDLQRHDAVTDTVIPPALGHDNVPGGAIKVPVSAGPDVVKVAKAYVEQALATKTALYWAAPDRHYQASANEQKCGTYSCPNCKDALRPASYQRQGGVSERLLACSGCLFLIKRADIIGHPEYVKDAHETPRKRLTEV